MNGPTISWVQPPSNVCALKTERLVVVADSTKKVSRVVFTDNGKRVGVDKGTAVYAVTWKTGKLKKGKHALLATIVDAGGRKAAAGRTVRVCK